MRKGDYLNVGIGRRESRDFGAHVKRFIALLEAQRHVEARRRQLRWRGHAYFASGVGPRPLVGAGMLIVGDSAGLAYPESGEGIQPAIASGRLAAETLVAAGGRLQRSRICTRTRRPSAACTPRRRRPAAPIRIRLSGDRPRAARISSLHEARRCSIAGS